MVGKVTPNNMMSASLVPALMGANPYTTRNDLLKRFIDIDEGTFVDGFAGNEVTQWGDRLEPVILAEASRRLGLWDTCFDYDEAFFHPDHPLACSLDGSGKGRGVVVTDVDKGIYCVNADEVTIDGRGILEAKNPSHKAEVVPALYRGPLQLQAQMMCTGLKWGAVCVLYGGNELRVFVYQAQPETQDQIVRALNDFEHRRKEYDWYPILSSDDGNTAYARVDDGAPELELDDSEALSYLEDLVEAKKQKKIAEHKINEAEAGLKEFLGSHEAATGLVGNTLYQVKWPMRTRKATAEKTVPAKPAEKYRQNTLTIRELST